MSLAGVPVFLTMAWGGLVLLASMTVLILDSERTPELRTMFHRSGLIGASLVTTSVSSLVALTVHRVMRTEVPNPLSGVQWTSVTVELLGCCVAVGLWTRQRYSVSVCVLGASVLCPPLILFWWLSVVAVPFVVVALALSAHIARGVPSRASASRGYPDG